MVAGDFNTVSRDVDRVAGSMQEYDEAKNAFSLRKLLQDLQFQDCALLGEIEPAFSFIQNGVPCSRIDAIYVNTAICKLTHGAQGIQHATSRHFEPLSGDHRAVVANMSLGRHFAKWGNKSHDRENGTMVRAISVCERPRRVKMDDASALKFQNTMSNDMTFKTASSDFMSTSPSTWASLARAMNFLQLPSIHVTSHSLDHALSQEGCLPIPDATGVLEESNHCLQLRRADRTVRDAMHGALDMDFSDMRSSVTSGADSFFRASSKCMSQASAPEHRPQPTTRPKPANPVISTGKVGEALRKWAQLELYTADTWASKEALRHRTEFSLLLTKCGIPMSLPPIPESHETWKQWARGAPGQPGAMASLVGWASTHQMVVVRQTILCPTSAQKVYSAKSKERQTALHTSLLTGRQSAGKIDGLNIAVDADGNDVPECDKIRLEQHILRIVGNHGSEKGVGHSAYAATAALHECMFITSHDWRGKSRIACRKPADVTTHVVTYAAPLHQ